MLPLARPARRCWRLRLALVLPSLLLGASPPSVAVAALPSVGLAGHLPHLMHASPRPARLDAVAQLLQVVNADRAATDAPPLELSDALMASAEVRAEELDAEGPLSHDRAEGSLLALVAEEGVDCTEVGETLARVPAPSPSAAVDRAHQMLLASEAHRDILLSPNFAYLGVAIRESRGQWLIVQVLTD